MAIEIELEKPQIAKHFDERKLRSTLSLIVCLALGLPLLLSGIGHLANTHIFLDSLYRYQLLPNGIVPYVASVLPALTAVTGGALILGQFTRASLFFAGTLFACFACAQLIQLASTGKPIDCGCFVWLPHQTSFWNVAVLILVSLIAYFASFMHSSNTALVKS